MFFGKTTKTLHRDIRFSTNSIGCMKIGVLLVNLGTPDSTSTRDVRRYLLQFLMDKRVIDIPYISRFLLVNGIIAPFRAPKSAKVYRQVWLLEGSPLKVHGERLTSKIEQNLGDQYVVKLAMRYQNPSIAAGMQALVSAHVSRIVVLPLFPQYASATTGSVYEEVMRVASSFHTIPSIHFAGTFFQAPFFIEPIVQQIRDALTRESYDQVLFSYHGLPERQITKGDRAGCCLKANCCNTFGPHNQLCYRAQCFETSRIIAAKLGLPAEKHTTSFQSRLGSDPWIKPYSDHIIRDWPKNGVKKVLALSPSFVADCLETTEEIGSEYKHLFEQAGGDTWHLLPCINDDDDWASGLSSWIASMTISPGHSTAAPRPN